MCGGGGLIVLVGVVGWWGWEWIGLRCGGGGVVWDEVVCDGWGFVVAALLLYHLEVLCGVGMGVGAMVGGVP